MTMQMQAFCTGDSTFTIPQGCLNNQEFHEPLRLLHVCEVGVEFICHATGLQKEGIQSKS